MPIAAGTPIGRYEVVGWLGAGGMGEVYRARDPRLDRDVAIKLISERFAADASRVRRFEQEARAAGQLNHPGILAVYDVGMYAGAPYIVSELLEGESLSSRLMHAGADGSEPDSRSAAAPLPFRKAVDYARQIAEGLAAAHDRHIVHRDVKPDNLFVTSDGRIKILDFGIAKLTRPVDDADGPTGVHTRTDDGVVVGTAGYMSPEQVRGESVDARSDLFSVGTILHEMLSGRAAFARGTAAEMMTAILKEEPQPPLPNDVPPGLARIVSRCLEKTREARFQSARDLAFALESFAADKITAGPASAAAPPRRWQAMAAAAVVVLSAAAAAAGWLTRGAAAPAVDFGRATFTLFTNWESAEEGAEISPNGELVAFLSDLEGEFDLYVSQVGTGFFHNLTRDLPPLASSGFIVRKLGFSADSSQIWFNPGDGKPPMIMPSTGGTARPLLPAGTNTPAWSPDGSSIVYVDKANRVDPIYVADRSGGNARQILAPGSLKNMNPVWSSDNQWIYFGRGSEPQEETEIDVWRMRPSGGAAERITTQHLAINFLAPLDLRTLLYVARAEDRSGPWLWSLDVQSGVSTRVPSGVDQYTSVSASRDGRRIVATVTNPSGGLWRVPLLGRLADERDVQPYALPEPTGLAFAPRFGRESLFYLSARGTGDGLWKVQDGKAAQIRRGVDGALSEPAAVSPDGSRLVVVVRQEGKRHLSIMSADGTNAKTFAASIEVEGAAGQGAADWSPDGTRIVTGGHDDKGPALFIIPVDTGVPTRLLDGQWFNPVWSPRGDLIVYAGRSLIGQVELRAVRPDGTPVTLPRVLVRPGGYRFLPDGSGLVYLERIPSLDFSFLDLTTRTARPLTRLENHGTLRTFDITPDGKQIVFDRSRQNSNIVLIELPK